MENLLAQSGGNAVRIAVVGPESTGKTTLCQALARHFDSQWVPEYMRRYCQQKWDEQRQSCGWDDILPIALGQIAEENRLAQQTDNFLFCDTCMIELAVYSQLYHGKCLPEIQAAALNHRYGMIFLTDIDVPWVADDLRDKPNEREHVFQCFQTFLDNHRIPYTLLQGNHRQRMNTALAALQQLS
ncbi:ATP-binding protein [Neisseria sp. ZJ106]|uniref:ATP-binding protein n=1 Tax=Neisseria lisongii TaxID=2912188 RepID=A0ABY7RH23_9NEIS|nr:ATP-binding protein [Neisseria lisongii]MCF7520868.1 ATP-binding protein [Neisseria lisongii]WCL70800.1 ATP-binding protein [Neisseria lisongii]